MQYEGSKYLALDLKFGHKLGFETVSVNSYLTLLILPTQLTNRSVTINHKQLLNLVTTYQSVDDASRIDDISANSICSWGKGLYTVGAGACSRQVSVHLFQKQQDRVLSLAGCG